MPIIRVRKTERYFVASNEPFNDARLSWEARGLMGYLLSKPNNWQVRTTDLKNKGPAGEDKIKRMLAELREYGYMNRIRVQREKGHFDWITEVYESPSENPNPSRAVRVTIGGKPTSGRATSGKPPDIVKTKEVKTKAIKTKSSRGRSRQTKYTDGPYSEFIDH